MKKSTTKKTENKIKILVGMPAMTKLQWLDLYNDIYVQKFSYKKTDSRYKTIVETLKKIQSVLKLETI